MSIKWTERRFSKSLQLQEQKDFLARKNSILPSEPLEEMVSCPIHLGIFEEPVQLPCGHSFCLECLERCLKTHMLNNNKFACPVCRIEWPVPLDGARGWPSSYALNDIISYVRQQKDQRHKINGNGSVLSRNNSQKMNRTGSCKRRTSIIEKTELVKRLTDEMNIKKLTDGTIDKGQLVSELSALLKQLQESPEHLTQNQQNSSQDPSRRTSFDTRCEMESTRQQMIQNCQYNVIEEKLPLELIDIILARDNKSDQSPNFHFDCIDIDEDPNYRKLVFVNSLLAPSYSLVVHDYQSSSNTQQFQLTLDSQNIQPVFLRIFQDYIYISAIKSDFTGVLLKYKLDGTLVAHTIDRFESTSDGADNLAVGGFDFDLGGQIYLSLPDTNSVVLLSPDLGFCLDKFEFADPLLSPRYMCYIHNTRQLWASCPRQEAVLILDLNSGNYSQFRTEQLFNSTPGHIVYTTDKRVCFLDSRISRVFWINKYNEYLLIQKCSLRNALLTRNKSEPMKIRAISATVYSPNMLIITDNSLFIVKPARDATKQSSHNNSCCNLM